MGWFNKKVAANDETDKYLLAKIDNFRQITREDTASHRLWMLNKDDNFLYRVIDEVTERDWKKLSPELYRISTDEFTFEYRCDGLVHPDIQGTVSGKFLIHAKLSPGKGGFADFIRQGGISKLESGDVLRDDQLRRFIQELLAAPSFSELNKSSNLNAAGTAVSGMLPDYLEVSRVEVVEISEKLSEAQLKIQAYNQWVSDNEENLQRERQKLEFDVELANLERTRSELAQAKEVAELEHRHDLELANIRYELEKDTLKQLQQNEIEKKRQIAELKIRHLEERLAEKKQIAADNRAIRDAELARINMQSAKEQQLLDLKIEEARLKKQQAEQAIEDNNKLLQAQINAVTNADQSNRMMIDMLQKMIEDNRRNSEIMISAIKERIVDTISTPRSYTEIAQQLTNLVMKQSSVYTVKLDKTGLQSNSRSIKLGSFSDAAQLTVDADYQSIRIEDPMQITINTPRSGYLTLLCWGSDGKVTLLSPNFLDDCTYLHTAVPGFFPIPGSRLAQFGIRQSGPEGRDRLLALITGEQLLTTPTEKDFPALDSTEIEALHNKLMRLPENSWSAGYCTYLVEK